MPIGAANQAELEGIHPELCFLAQSMLEHTACVLVLQHPVFFFLRVADVEGIPVFEVGKLIGRRQLRMRFAVTFHLSDFEQRFPTTAHLRVRTIQRFAVEHLLAIHQAVRQIAIVTNGHDLATGLRFIVRKRRPQVPGVNAVLRGERRSLCRLVSTILVDHHTMQIAAMDHRRPFVAYECRELARVIMLISRHRDIGPDLSPDIFGKWRIVLRIIDAAGKGGHHFC